MGRAAEIERNGNRVGIEEWKRNEEGKGSFEAAGVGGQGCCSHREEEEQTMHENCRELRTIKIGKISTSLGYTMTFIFSYKNDNSKSLQI